MPAVKKMSLYKFKNQINKAFTEEMVKSIYSQYFNIKYNTFNHHDLHTTQVFFEF